MAEIKVLPYALNYLGKESSPRPDQYDCLVILYTGLDSQLFQGPAEPYYQPLAEYAQYDKAATEGPLFLLLPSERYPIRNAVYTPIKPLTDYDDVRVFADAAKDGIKRALASGAKRVLIYLPSDIPQDLPRSHLVAILGALEALYVPLEVHEAYPEKLLKVSSLGIANLPASAELQLAAALESGRIVCRDIGGSDPERMAAPRVEEYVSAVFHNSPIKVEVIKGDTINKEFPLLAAVNRAAQVVPRHQARVILLTYIPEGPVDTTLVLVGKGVTYDTGGADIKHGGAMAGMHRDKCGAAAVAGFFQVLNQLRPKGIKVLGGMSMVRNSVGPDSYVSDEIITSRSGKRIRIGNTDAEGRMAMADVLCYLKEKVVNEPNAHLLTLATLTGHACLAVGSGYTIILDNGPAKKAEVGRGIQRAGDQVGDMVEISTIRPEDFEFNRGKSEYEDIIQSNSLPSSRTPRGHQVPAAFLLTVSGLDKHGTKSEKPLKYSHMDIAGSEGSYPGIPVGAPISALSSYFLLNRL